MAGQSRLRDGGGIVSDGDWFSPKAPDVLAQAGPRLQSAMDWLANCVSRCSKSFSPHGEAGSHCGELAQSVCSA